MPTCAACRNGLRRTAIQAGTPHGGRSIPGSNRASGIALDRLLEAGLVDAHRHASAPAHGALRRRSERSGGPFRSWRTAVVHLKSTLVDAVE